MESSDREFTVTNFVFEELSVLEEQTATLSLEEFETSLSSTRIPAMPFMGMETKSRLMRRRRYGSYRRYWSFFSKSIMYKNPAISTSHLKEIKY